MPVIWRPSREFATAGLAVPCGGCNVGIGQPCRPGFDTPEHRRQREEHAEALGFVTLAAFDDSPLAKAADAWGEFGAACLRGGNTGGINHG